MCLVHCDRDLKKNKRKKKEIKNLYESNKFFFKEFNTQQIFQRAV
jgi:hypothetical protein